MSWFSDEHKTLYSKALGALYDDVKDGASVLIDTTGKLVSTGYKRVREGADYLDRRYHDVPPGNKNNDNNGDDGRPENPYYEYSTEEPSEIDLSDDTDNYLVEMGKTYPDILVNINRNHSSIIRIWVIDEEGNKKQVRGKIASYSYVNKIIHRWFEYAKRDERGHKWYPTNELYTAYRNSSARMNSMDNVVFRYGQSGYKPYHYHPLF